MSNTTLKIYYLANKNENKQEKELKGFCNLEKIKELAKYFTAPKNLTQKESKDF